MENLLLIVHVIIALAIIGLIMIQQGKGAEMGASFGSGASQTVFGAAGTGNFFSRTTAILVAVFFATSLVLAMLSKESGSVQDVDMPVLETVQESTDNAGALEDGEVPVVEDDAAANDEVPAVESEESTEEIPE